MIEQQAPTVRSISQSPGLNRLIGQTALVQIVKRFFSRCGFQHLLAVKCDSGFHNINQGVAFLVVFFISLSLWFECNTGFISQLFECFLEIKVIPLHHKAKQITALIALPKAAPGLWIGEDDKCRRASIAVKWAKADIVFASSFEFDRLTDNINQVDSLFDVFYYCHIFPTLWIGAWVNFTLDSLDLRSSIRSKIVLKSTRAIVKKPKRETIRSPFSLHRFDPILNLWARIVLVHALQFVVSVLGCLV